MTNDSQPEDMDSLKQAAMAEWEAKWEAMDFSWEGLADAGWDLDEQASEAQKLKRWYKFNMPQNGELQVSNIDEQFLVKKLTLQDYWRSVTPWKDLTDDQLIEKGVLKKINGKLWHIIHAPDKTPFSNDMLINFHWIPALNHILGISKHKELIITGARLKNLPPLQAMTITIGVAILKASYVEFENYGLKNQTFNGNLNFDNAIFNGIANFEGNYIDKGSSFRGTYFCDKANFHEATFEDRASFVGAKFCGPTRFEGATFNGAAFFKGCTLPEAFKDSLNAFRATRFYELVSFDAVNISCFAAFHETRFFKGVILSQPGERRAQELWDKALNAVNDATKDKDKPTKERYFAALEGGCRVLKQEMEKIADRSREQRYYRYELIARRHRPDINRMEKLFSHIYGLTSDYGHSIGRPLLYLGGLFLLMMLGVFLIAIIGAGTLGFDLNASPHPALADSFAIAWQNIVKPGAVWDIRFPLSVPALTAAFNGPSLPIWLKAVASVHSALSFVCLFLVGVAIRRKFRID